MVFQVAGSNNSYLEVQTKSRYFRADALSPDEDIIMATHSITG